MNGYVYACVCVMHRESIDKFHRNTRIDYCNVRQNGAKQTNAWQMKCIFIRKMTSSYRTLYMLLIGRAKLNITDSMNSNFDSYKKKFFSFSAQSNQTFGWKKLLVIFKCQSNIYEVQSMKRLTNIRVHTHIRMA